MRTVDIQSIRLESVTFGYPGRTPIFNGFDFEPPKHPLVWLKSSQGTGKSSLLKILAGLLTPQSGRYFIGGVDVLDLSFKEFLPYRFAIGYSFDSGGLLSNRTLFENLLLPLVFHKNLTDLEASQRVLHWMKRFNILQVKDQRPFSVTGSQRKSAVVLRALLHYPQIALLDDPMSGLKEDGRKAFVELYEECREKHALKQVLFSAERELPIASVSAQAVQISAEREHVQEAS